MLRRTLLAALCAALVAVPAGAATKTLTYKGQATSVDTDFKYGKVTIKRKGAKVTFVEIKAVTASCSGQSLLRTIVYRPGAEGTKTIGGGKSIKGGKWSVLFLPVEDVEDARTAISIKFSGSKATGTFSETGPCSDEGKFTAKR